MNNKRPPLLPQDKHYRKISNDNLGEKSKQSYTKSQSSADKADILDNNNCESNNKFDNLKYNIYQKTHRYQYSHHLPKKQPNKKIFLDTNQTQMVSSQKSHYSRESSQEVNVRNRKGTYEGQTNLRQQKQKMISSNDQKETHKRQKYLQNDIQRDYQSDSNKNIQERQKGLGRQKSYSYKNQTIENTHLKIDSHNFPKISNQNQITKIKLKYGSNFPPKSNQNHLKITNIPSNYKKNFIQLKSQNNKYHFLKIKQLGKGTYGRVFLVQQYNTKTVYALKIISKQRINQLKCQNNIIREIKIQSLINHRNITKLYQVFNDQENIYLLMQYVKQSLDDIRNHSHDNQFSEEKTSRIMDQLCSAVLQLQRHKIMHRDLKLQNILAMNFLSHQYVVKIGDFGCSVDSNKLRDTVIGSYAYFSPQQLKKQLYGQKIDNWSLGIITYQLIFGETPFDEQIISIKNRQKRNLSDLKFPKHHEISEQAKDFILRLLEKDHHQRLTLQSALNHEFITMYRQYHQD